MSFHKMISKILDLLSRHERKRAAMLLLMCLAVAFLDMLGVASIMPFLAVLANPEMIQTSAVLSHAYAASSRLGVNTNEQFLVVLGMLVFFLLVGSLGFKALTSYAQLRFTMLREYSISKRLVEGYLHQPYSWFLNRHSADLGTTILSEVAAVVGGVITPMMTLVSQGALAAALLALLILINPKLALITGLTLAATYAVIFRVTRGVLARMGALRLAANRARFAAVSEAFSASKEVKVGGLEDIYTERFAVSAHHLARITATAGLVNQLPRFALEAIVFGGILLLVLYLMSGSGSFSSALPIIAAYAFAGYRLMPALQQIYSAATQLRFAGAALDSLHADLMSLQPAQSSPSKDVIVLSQAITLNEIRYSYPKASQPALKSVSLSIAAKSTVGIVGATGSGKTTIVDLILGLHEAQEGTLEVDGQVITERNRRSWQRAIGYVPQQIYLADDTVAANIAFGLNQRDIDPAAVEHAAKIANLHDFVVNELPQQYQTTVGERGVRLSGGQRQRIGIARALYHNPQVLILDEATSALDNLTEQAVMEAVHNLGHQLTVILIAHRLSTVKKCDQIVLMERGTIKAIGTFDELAEKDHLFGRMAKEA